MKIMFNGDLEFFSEFEAAYFGLQQIMDPRATNVVADQLFNEFFCENEKNYLDKFVSDELKWLDEISTMMQEKVSGNSYFSVEDVIDRVSSIARVYASRIDPTILGEFSRNENLRIVGMLAAGGFFDAIDNIQEDLHYEIMSDEEEDDE